MTPEEREAYYNEPTGMAFDRAGLPISLREWGELREVTEYHRVAEDTIGSVWISTVWLGIDHGMSSYMGGPPIIFETMTFVQIDEASSTEFEIGGTWRYATEAQAIAGHAEVCEGVRVHGVNYDRETEDG